MLEITEYDGVKIPSKFYEVGDGADICPGDYKDAGVSDATIWEIFLATDYSKEDTVAALDKLLQEGMVGYNEVAKNKTIWGYDSGWCLPDPLYVQDSAEKSISLVETN